MGCEPARLQPVRPCRPWAVPPGSGAASLSPLVLPRRFAGRGRCGQPRGPRARTRAAVQPPSAPPSPLPRLPLLAAAGGRALPAALGPGSGAACVWRGFSTGRYRAPSLAARSRSEPGGARAGPRLFPGLACRSGSDSCRRSILSPCPRTVASWKAAFTALCIPRAGFPGPSCSRLRQVSACRLSPPLLTFRRRLGCGRVCNKSFDFWTHVDPLKVGALGPASMVEGWQCL